MSTAYSAPINYGESIPLQSVQTIGMVQTAMSQKYDANLAKVDEIVNQYSSLALARPEDKQYLGERLQTLLTAVDGAKGLNWTDGNTVRMLSQHISKAVDPYIVQQAGITRTIQNFQEEVSKKKAKNPELYSDDNYTYAMKKAGYDKYMAKGSDTIGALEYSDYYDPQKNLIEPLEKWAEKLGYQKTVNTTTGEYSYVHTEYGSLTQDRINNYVTMRLDSDPKLKKQFEINGWSKYQGVSDDVLKSKYGELVTADKNNIDSLLIEKKAELLKYPKDSDEYKQTEQDIKAKEQELANANLMLQNPEKYYNRDSFQTNMYESEMKKKIIDTYAKTDVLGVKMDWIPSHVIEAEKEKKKLLVPGGLGVRTEVEYTPAEIEATNYTEKNKIELNSQYSVVKQTANKLLENDKDYQNLTENKKTEFINNIIKQGGKVHFGGDMDAGLINEVSKYRQLALKRNEDVKNVVARFDDDVRRVYNSLLEDATDPRGSDIQWDNLSQTLPQTVNAVKAKKTYEELTAKEKVLVKADIITNKKNTAESSVEKSYYNTYLDNLKKENPNVFVTNKKILNQPIAPGYTPGKYKYAASSALEQGYRDVRESFYEGVENFGAALINTPTRVVKDFMRSDENLSEIGTLDVSSDDGFKNSIATLERTINDRNAREAETVKKRTQITFNSNIKEEKRIVDVLQSISKAKLGTEIPNSAFATVSLDIDKQMAYIKIDTKQQQTSLSGKGFATVFDQKYIPVPFGELDKGVLSAFDTTKSDFTFSVKNPQKYEKTFVHKISNTPDENFKKITTVLEKYNLPDDVATRMLTDPASMGLTTKQDYYQEYAGRVNTSDIDKVVDSNYEVQMFKKPNIGFFYNIVQNGKIVGTPILYIDQTTGIPVDSIKESDFLLETPFIIDTYIKKALNTYVTK